MFRFHAVLLDVETAFYMENWKKKYTWKYRWATKKFIKRQKKTLFLNYKWQCMDWCKQHNNGLNV